MPSFAWSNRFREGQWKAFRKFMLEERRDASSRFKVIEAERNRIGDIRILFERNEDGVVTERRVGFSVTPLGSSLAKLLAAYSALGGNPFDISMFSGPDQSVSVANEVLATAPSGGVLHPQDIKYSYDVGVTDGDMSLLKFKASRIGGRRVTEKEQETLGITNRGKVWIRQEIWHKRTKIEELIIKLMDLREQLDQEVEDMVWATYGDMIGDPGYNPDRFNDSLTAGNIAYFFDSTFRIPDPDEKGLVRFDNTVNEGEPGAVNAEVLAGFANLISDEDEEENSAL